MVKCGGFQHVLECEQILIQVSFSAEVLIPFHLGFVGDVQLSY